MYCEITYIAGEYCLRLQSLLIVHFGQLPVEDTKFENK